MWRRCPTSGGIWIRANLLGSGSRRMWRTKRRRRSTNHCLTTWSESFQFVGPARVPRVGVCATSRTLRLVWDQEEAQEHQVVRPSRFHHGWLWRAPSRAFEVCQDLARDEEDLCEEVPRNVCCGAWNLHFMRTPPTAPTSLNCCGTTLQVLGWGDQSEGVRQPYEDHKHICLTTGESVAVVSSPSLEKVFREWSGSALQATPPVPRDWLWASASAHSGADRTRVLPSDHREIVEVVQIISQKSFSESASSSASSRFLFWNSLHAAKVFLPESVQLFTVEQIMQVPFPQFVNEIIEAIQIFPQEPFCQAHYRANRRRSRIADSGMSRRRCQGRPPWARAVVHSGADCSPVRWSNRWSGPDVSTRTPFRVHHRANRRSSHAAGSGTFSKSRAHATAHSGPVRGAVVQNLSEEESSARIVVRMTTCQCARSWKISSMWWSSLLMNECSNVLLGKLSVEVAKVLPGERVAERSVDLVVDVLCVMSCWHFLFLFAFERRSTPWSTHHRPSREKNSTNHFALWRWRWRSLRERWQRDLFRSWYSQTSSQAYRKEMCAALGGAACCQEEIERIKKSVRK